MASRKYSDKWSQLETLLFETPEKIRAPPLTAKASLKSGPGNGRVFKFIRTNQGPETTFPKSLNVLNNTFTPDRNKPQMFFEIDSKRDDDLTRTTVPVKPVASYNSIEDDFEASTIDKKGVEESKDMSTVNKRKFLTPDSKQTFIITTNRTTATTNNNKSLKKIASNSLNDLDKYKIVDPICGIEDSLFRVLFRKKCEDMSITPHEETEEMFISNIRKKSLGTKLCFYESGFAKSSLQHLALMIQNNPEVSQLILRKSAMSENALVEPFAKSLAFMPNLIHLDLANNGFSAQDFKVLFKNLSLSKTLISIDFSNYEPDKKNKLGFEGVEAFSEFVKNNAILQFVTLSNLMLEDDQVELILKALEECSNLLVLNLTSNVFGGKCLEGLNELFSKTSLITLDLSDNKLKKEAALNLSKFIRAQRGEEKILREGVELILRNTGLGGEINTIFEALGRGSCIKKLDFSDNVLPDIEITTFESALKDNRKIQELNLSGCKLGEIGGRTLAIGLNENRSIQNLILANNNLGDRAGASIIYSLLDNFSLKSLDLSQNKLTEKSSKALQEIIKRNPSVTKYSLSLNNFEEPEGYLLQEALFFNSKIIKFDISHSRVKFNTLEAIEGIIKDNLNKVQFGTVPKLKEEVNKRRIFIKDEKHHLVKVEEFNKKKEEVRRDVKRFQETLTDLRSREKSPTFKKKERLLMKLSKDIKETAPVIEDLNSKIRNYKTATQLEKESFNNIIQAENVEIEKLKQKIEEKKEEIEKVKQKFEPELKKLRHEISRLQEENRFNEMYNNTLVEKIKTEKQVIAIQTSVAPPKVSDVFLASSELARFKKKNDSPEQNSQNTSVKNNNSENPSLSSQTGQQDSKLAKELELFQKNRQSRTDKLIEEIRQKDEKAQKRILRKQNSKSDNSKHELIKAKIDEKLKNMFKEDKTRMEPISEGEIKD